MSSAFRNLPSPVRAMGRTLYSFVPFPWNLGWTFAKLHNRFWKSQHASPEELTRLQEHQLRNIVRWAHDTTPAYREIFQELNLRPDDIRSLEDLQCLPLTKKNDVRENPGRFRSTEIPTNAILTHRTSGSTGTPLSIYSIRETWLAERAMMYRGWRWAGYQPGDRVITCVGELEGVRPDDVAPYHEYRNQAEISPHHLDERGCTAYVEFIEAFQPNFIRTYPDIAYLLGKYYRDSGRPLPPIKGIWTQSEALYESDRKEIEALWNAKVRDYYGMQEKCVAMSECEKGTMHVHSEFGHVELVPTAGDTPYYQIVATGFWNRAMPLLRYATGDLAVPGDHSCRCGRALPAINNLLGRVEDILIASNGRPVMEIDRALNSIPYIRECQIVQDDLRKVRVLVVPDSQFDERHRSDLIRRIQQEVGSDVSVEVERVSQLTRTSSGKIRFIISNLPEQCQIL